MLSIVIALQYPPKLWHRKSSTALHCHSAAWRGSCGARVGTSIPPVQRMKPIISLMMRLFPKHNQNFSGLYLCTFPELCEPPAGSSPQMALDECCVGRAAEWYPSWMSVAEVFNSPLPSAASSEQCIIPS